MRYQRWLRVYRSRQLFFGAIEAKLRKREPKCRIGGIENSSGRRSLLWLGWQILRGRTADLAELERFHVTEVVIEMRRSSPHVALDGELLTMRGALAFRVLPGALRVFAPVPPRS